MYLIANQDHEPTDGEKKMKQQKTMNSQCLEWKLKGINMPALQCVKTPCTSN